MLHAANSNNAFPAKPWSRPLPGPFSRRMLGITPRAKHRSYYPLFVPAATLFSVQSGGRQPNEAELTNCVVALWERSKATSASARKIRQELADLRDQLGARLFELKTVLAKAGRSGEWTGFLRNQGIPRTTADRYVQRHERSTFGDAGNRSTEAISKVPDGAALDAMVQRHLRKLIPVLTSETLLEEYIAQLSARLNGGSMPRF